MFDDSPLVQEIVQETRLKTIIKTTREAVQKVLETRFGNLPPRIAEGLNAVGDERRLSDLVAEAVRSSSLDDFRARLVSSPAP